MSVHQIIVVGDPVYGCIINPDYDCGNDNDTKNNKWDYGHFNSPWKIKNQLRINVTVDTDPSFVSLLARTNQSEKRNVPTWQLKRDA